MSSVTLNAIYIFAAIWCLVGIAFAWAVWIQILITGVTDIARLVISALYYPTTLACLPHTPKKWVRCGVSGLLASAVALLGWVYLPSVSSQLISDAWSFFNRVSV